MRRLQQTGASNEEQLGAFGKRYRLDLCPSCHAVFSQMIATFIGGNVEVLGTFEDVKVKDDPFGPIGTFTARGNVQLPVPQPDTVWWTTPADASPATRKTFKEARDPIWEWAHEQKNGKGHPRFPGLSEHCQGAIPREVGFAYTEEVLLIEDEDTEPEEPSPEQALIPAPPKGKPRRRPARAN